MKPVHAFAVLVAALTLAATTDPAAHAATPQTKAPKACLAALDAAEDVIEETSNFASNLSAYFTKLGSAASSGNVSVYLTGSLAATKEFRETVTVSTAVMGGYSTRYRTAAAQCRKAK